MSNPKGGGWRAAAACRGVGPSLFYNPSPKSAARAKAICAGCPVICECGAHAATVGEFGIWGGLTEGERPECASARPGPTPAVDDDGLIELFDTADPDARAHAVLRRITRLGPRSLTKYLRRARELGLIERRNGRLYPTDR